MLGCVCVPSLQHLLPFCWLHCLQLRQGEHIKWDQLSVQTALRCSRGAVNINVFTGFTSSSHPGVCIYFGDAVSLVRLDNFIVELNVSPKQHCYYSVLPLCWALCSPQNLRYELPLPAWGKLIFQTRQKCYLPYNKATTTTTKKARMSFSVL